MRLAHTIVILIAVILLVSFVTGCETVPRGFHEGKVKDLNSRIDALESQLAELNALRAENKLLRDKLKIMGEQKSIYDSLSSELKKILDSLSIEGVQRIPGNGWRFEVDLLFKPGSDEISKKGVEVLGKFASAWKGQPVKLKIVGHTDRDPIVKSAKKFPTKTNLELGTARSVSVMAVLLQNGIAENRMFLVSQGNNEPTAPNDNSPANKKKNRRVEIYILEE